MGIVFRALLFVFCGSLAMARAAEVIPPAPEHYFNDYAHVVSPATASRLNETLKDFERRTSNQILVAIYPKMESDSSIEDYTVRVAQSWKVGQRAKDNGAVLFVFVQDRKMFIQVGYGLEGALPDALAVQIIDREIKPRFQQGDYDGGLTAGVNAMLAAVQGEYKGTGRTVAESKQGQSGLGVILVFLVLGVVGLALLRALSRGGAGTVYGRRGYSSWGGWPMGGGGWPSGGGGWGGGGSGGGDFSGGGGRFGGGGAGGSW